MSASNTDVPKTDIPKTSVVIEAPKPSSGVFGVLKNLRIPSLDDTDLSETEARYAAYAARISQFAKVAAQSKAGLALMGIKRYFAYTSDVGEAFRPVVPKGLVTSCYAISWAYVLGDVGVESAKAYKATQDTNETLRYGSQRLVFNALASMLLPMMTIHTVVHQVQRLTAQNASKFVRAAGPSAAGLAVLPALPFMFDYPVEVACEKAWDYFWPDYKYRPHHHHDATPVKVEAPTNVHFISKSVTESADTPSTVTTPVTAASTVAESKVE